MRRKRGYSYKQIQEMKARYITHDGGPMDRRTYLVRIPDFTPEQKRCLSCSYFVTFRSKVPVCRADTCCFIDELTEKEELNRGNKD